MVTESYSCETRRTLQTKATDSNYVWDERSLKNKMLHRTHHGVGPPGYCRTRPEFRDTSTRKPDFFRWDANSADWRIGTITWPRYLPQTAACRPTRTRYRLDRVISIVWCARGHGDTSGTRDASTRLLDYLRVASRVSAYRHCGGH